MDKLTLAEATRLFGVSRATLERRIKSGALKRSEDGTISVDELDSLFSRRQPDVSDNTSSDTSTISSDVSQENTYLRELAAALRTELDTSKDREQKAQEEKAQLLRQLDQAQVLLLQEQQNIKLLTEGRSQETEQRERWMQEQIERLTAQQNQPQRPGLRDRLRRFWRGSE